MRLVLILWLAVWITLGTLANLEVHKPLRYSPAYCLSKTTAVAGVAASYPCNDNFGWFKDV